MYQHSAGEQVIFLDPTEEKPVQNHFYISYNKNRPTAIYKRKDTKEKAIVKVLKESNLSAPLKNIAQILLFPLSGNCSVR